MRESVSFPGALLFLWEVILAERILITKEEIENSEVAVVYDAAIFDDREIREKWLRIGVTPKKLYFIPVVDVLTLVAVKVLAKVDFLFVGIEDNFTFGIIDAMKLVVDRGGFVFLLSDNINFISVP